MTRWSCSTAPHGRIVIALPRSCPGCLGTLFDEMTRAVDQAWVIVSDRIGDARQAFALADAIGVSFQAKHAIPIQGSIRVKKARGRNPFESLDPVRSSRFDAPWPSFVIAVGNWPVAVALALQKRSKTRIPIVLIGRPRPGHFHRFAAIVASSQFGIPEHPKVIRPVFPPRAHEPHLIPSSVRSDLAELRRPITAVLVGGPTQPFRFDTDVAGELADELIKVRRRDGGTLCIVTSPRTPAAIASALRERLGAAATFIDHTDLPDRSSYLALLALADRFVVTGDSVTMMMEAAAQNRPLAIFDLPDKRGAFTSISMWTRNRLAERARTSGFGPLLMTLHSARLIGFGRDLRILHRELIARGIATSMTDAFAKPRSTLPDELHNVARSVRHLLGIESSRPETHLADSYFHSAGGPAQCK